MNKDKHISDSDGAPGYIDPRVFGVLFLGKEMSTISRFEKDV